MSAAMSTEVVKDEDRPNEEWPDKELLETALRNWLDDPKVKVRGFRSRIATNKGDNHTSNMYRVTIQCDGRRDALNVIIKRLIAGELITKSSALAREVQILNTVVPEVHALLNKVVPDVEPSGAGHIYSTPGVLVMEDLQQEGFRMAPRHFGLDLNHCSLVLQALARYHAATVYLIEHKSMDFSVFRHSLFEELNHEKMDNFCAGMVRALSTVVQNLEGMEKYSDRLSALAEDDYYGRMLQAIDSHEEGDFLVLSHGDLWVNNMLFRYSPSGEPNGVRFVDFQLSSLTSPCIDLQYFLNSSSNETVRTTCREQLMEEYHATLSATMAALECSTRPPTVDELWEDFYKRCHYGMFAAFSVLPAVLSQPGQFDFNDVVRTGKPQDAMFAGETFRKGLQWYLQLYESKGLL